MTSDGKIYRCHKPLSVNTPLSKAIHFVPKARVFETPVRLKVTLTVITGGKGY